MRALALAPAFALFVTAPALATPQVTIPQGTLAGTTDGNISVFKSIPFAAPPVGDLRWREPQPAPSWPGTRDASQFGPICPQAPARKAAADASNFPRAKIACRSMFGHLTPPPQRNCP